MNYLECTMSRPSNVYKNKMIHNDTWGWSYKNLLTKIDLLTKQGWIITKPVKHCKLIGKEYKRIKSLKYFLGTTTY